YSGVQPAITALMATFSAVTVTNRSRMYASFVSGASRAASSIACTADSVGGTTGKPSLQPRWKQKSTAAAKSFTLKRLDVSVPGMTALLVPSQTGDATLPPAAASPQPRASLAGERKQVTVLFADLKGSLELLADRDPEDARALLDAVLERMMEAVHRYEGTVNQVMGDGIMALFGAPVAREDHAVRACY